MLPGNESDIGQKVIYLKQKLYNMFSEHFGRQVGSASRMPPLDYEAKKLMELPAWAAWIEGRGPPEAACCAAAV